MSLESLAHVGQNAHLRLACEPGEIFVYFEFFENITFAN